MVATIERFHCNESYSSECLVWCQVLGRDVVFLAGRAGELVLTEVVLDAAVAVALPTAGDDGRVLHQLLADAADQLWGGLHLLGHLLCWTLSLLLEVLHSFPEKNGKI